MIKMKVTLPHAQLHPLTPAKVVERQNNFKPLEQLVSPPSLPPAPPKQQVARTCYNALVLYCHQNRIENITFLLSGTSLVLMGILHPLQPHLLSPYINYRFTSPLPIRLQ